MDFRNYLRKKVLKPADRILEFGPLARPTVTKSTHPSVRFADIRSSDDIKKLYTSNDYLESTGLAVDLGSIVDIDYVVKGNYRDFFKGIEKFDTVILSHVIEHMPDILSFFEDVRTLLKPNGRLVLIYPDARYCFDHFRNGTTFIDAYDVYLNNNNSGKRVFDFVFNVVQENNASFFWGDKDQNKVLPRNSFESSVAAFEKAKNNVLPDDTHFWPFADHQFIKFLYDMDRADLFKFEIEEFYPTQENTQEFMLILVPKKGRKFDYKKYIKILDKVSPSINNIKNRDALTIAENKVATLESDIERLNRELHDVYNSKKWKYAHKVGILKNSILGRNGKQ